MTLPTDAPEPTASRTRIDTLLRYVGVALLVYFAVQALTLNQCSKVARLVGEDAPQLQSIALRGENLHIGGPREKPLVLDFWASWCGPCRASMPSLHTLAADYRGRVDFFTVNVEGDRPPDFVALAAQGMGVTLPIIHDPSQAIAARFRVDSLPTLVVIDRAGKISWTHIGSFSESSTRTALDAALQR